MDQHISGAARLQTSIAELEHGLKANITAISGLLDPKVKRDAARLNHLILDTNRKVHDGFRLVATSGQVKTAELAQAPDEAAQANVRHAWIAVGPSLHRLQLSLVKWPIVQSLIQPQVVRRRRPLFERPETLPDTTRTRELTSDRLFAELHDLINTVAQDQGAYEHGCFSDIPLAQSFFLKEVHAARRLLLALRPGAPMRFLDVGCGVGLKVISAAKYFDRAVGLEFDPGYAALAGDLFHRLHHGQCRVIEGDALTFEHYDDFDVIYFFRPIRDDDLLGELERHILTKARPGTLLIAPYRIFGSRAPDYDCARVAGHIYLTGASDKEAARLCREAEYFGPDLPHEIDANVPILWDPIIKASQMNGFSASVRPASEYSDPNA